MAEASAPGKLYIAGEYAVVEPGHPSIVVAVDRFITAHISGSQTPDKGSIRSRQNGIKEASWTRQNQQVVLDEDNPFFAYVLEAIHVVEEWLLESGGSVSSFYLDIESELDSSSGHKIGLGSSAAVTVAVIRALLRFYRLPEEDETIYKLAALAHMRLGSNGSFGDLAASTFTGWVAYSSFDRGIVREWMRTLTLSEVIEREWPAFSARSLIPPKELTLLIGWTGSPASTTHLVGKVQEQRTSSVEDYKEFLSESKACVSRMIEAFEKDDVSSIQSDIRINRSLLNQLKKITGVVIETPALTELCEIAELHGAAAKTSGAGGGDSGIALCDARTDRFQLIEQWKQSDITPLPLNVYTKDTTS